MKLDSKSNYLVSKYQIDMEKIITPYYNLFLELCQYTKTSKDVAFALWIETVFDLPRISGIDHLPDYTSKDAFLPILSEYLENQLYQCFTDLCESIICLYSDEKIVISKHSNQRDVKNVLRSWVKSYNPIEKLLELIVSDDIRNLSKCFKPFYNEDNYSSYIEVTDYNAWQSCIITKDWLDYSKIDEVEVDPCSIWVGKEIKDRLGKSKPGSIKQLQSAGKSIGMSFDEIVLPFECMDDFISATSYQQYFGEMLNNVYAAITKGVVKNTDHDKFLEAGKDSKFSRLLSYLQYNLYISDDIRIPKKYAYIFEPVYCLNNLPGLDNRKLFIGKPSGTQERKRRTLSGMYEIEKTESEYNLRNWVNAIPDGYEVANGNVSTPNKCKVVYALKPQYSYYFISKYYEDYFASILVELGCKHKCNVQLYKGNQNFVEIDAFIVKPDGKLIYVENKTCMNKNNIEVTMGRIVKFQNLISQEYRNVKIDYYLTSPYCDNSLEQNYLYFIKKGNSQTRKGVKHKLYNFDIPLAQFNDLSLHCIVEPEYNKMKDIVSEILK